MFFFLCVAIWDALRAATEADLATAKLILESAGVIVASEVSNKNKEFFFFRTALHDSFKTSLLSFFFL